MNFLSNFLNNQSDEIFTARETGGFNFLSKSFINPKVAQTNSDVFGCINIKSNALAVMPQTIYKKTKEGREEATNHPLYTLLKFAPNPNITAFEHKKMIVQDIDLRGNHYCQIIKNGLGDIVSLYPLQADKMDVKETINKQKIYYYDGVIVPNNRILHYFEIPNGKGTFGISKIQFAKDSIEFAHNASRFGNQLFKNQAAPSGAFEADGVLDDDAYNRLVQDIEKRYTSLEKAGKPLVLEDGLKFKPISLSNSDSQWLESRRFNREQIATFFGVPVAMLNDATNTSYGNLEQKYLEFQTTTILALNTLIEQKNHLSLLKESEKKSYFTKFNNNALMRVDAKSRAEYYKSMFMTGTMSPNEIRAKEDLNSYSGGDEFFIQLNQDTVNNIANKGKANE